MTLVACAGMITEVGLLVCSVRKDKLRVLALPAVTGVVYLITALCFDKIDYFARFFTPMIGLGFVTVILFAGELMPAITKYHVLSFTIIFWYLFAAGYLVPPSMLMGSLFMAFCACCSVAATLSLFLRGNPIPFIRPLLYIWHIMIVALAGWSQFSGKALDFDATVPAAKLPGPLVVFITGMAAMYLIILFIDLQLMTELFLTGRGWEDDEDHSEFGKMIKNVFRNKFQDIVPNKPNMLALILGLQFLLTCLNYRLKLLSPFLFANCCLLAMPRLVTLMTTDPAVAQQASLILLGSTKKKHHK